MSLLSGRNQLARAVLNPNPMDFCTKDLLTTTSERIVSADLNEVRKLKELCQDILAATWSCTLVHSGALFPSVLQGGQVG